MKLKRFILPIMVASALTLTTACDKEETEAGCEGQDITESCDLSEVNICYDEETEEAYYTYKGKSYKTVDEVINAACPDVSISDKDFLTVKLSKNAKSLMMRIRATYVY